MIGTAGNVSDISQAEALLHGQEVMVFADAGYQGVEKRSESQGSEVEWQVAMKPSKRKQLAGTELGRLVEQVEYAKAVSYTHLDVYKRQGRIRSVKKTTGPSSKRST